MEHQSLPVKIREDFTENIASHEIVVKCQMAAWMLSTFQEEEMCTKTEKCERTYHIWKIECTVDPLIQEGYIPRPPMDA